MYLYNDIEITIENFLQIGALVLNFVLFSQHHIYLMNTLNS